MHLIRSGYGEFSSINSEFRDGTEDTIRNHMLSVYGLKYSGGDWNERWIWDIVDSSKFTIFQLKHGNLIERIE
jgi:hypothetical protein